ncbi:family 43 glycosylhydrolase [Microbacterium sp.]|uniref:glycoside hydrolase family 43 protein n=1 Tax=Microbacterium sp. TaxID=51671 RepID=UPI003A951DB3
MRNPILPGFNPDPSIVCVDGVYYLVTSTFEYLPALPIYRSADLESWELIGHVATREKQVGIAQSPTPGGAWAPTIRHHDGRFHVIVSVMFNARGCVVFTADAAEGPWSDGVVIPAVDGIDPDLAWDDDGTAYVTYAVMGQGIRQVRVDLETGGALEEPRGLWSGTGLHAPEGPHLYQRGNDWYLLIAEGGTERGHAVSIARGPSPSGPFEGCVDNPILSARSTGAPVQNVGHADLVETPDGGTALVALGVRPVGFTRAFSPLGRETFLTTVDWVDGWPRPRPILVDASPDAIAETLDPARPLDEQGWIAVRQTPSELVQADQGRVILRGHGTDLGDLRPCFVGRRQQHHAAVFSARVNVSEGTGGIAGRHSDVHWFAIQAELIGDSIRVTARAALSGFVYEQTAELGAGEVVLTIRTRLPRGDRPRPETGGDRIQLVVAHADAPDDEVLLVELDGRYWSFETTESFTGRVLGLYSIRGPVRFADVRYEGIA